MTVKELFDFVVDLTINENNIEVIALKYKNPSL